ncbi:hypothetical protein LOY44_16825 [Pseudomonas sp. B21-044]|uniref:hypothetical protein n=1 Tax=Pseudomonas sp. B21-044 TaxID=2895488 RepID=UPI00215E409B|nr:hypothetical protein [Pseudomonas sp. B21-044]UVL17666.1 hypothetical protein LOY44_16825 [Pseudomonas sp. B21-044]
MSQAQREGAHTLQVPAGFHHHLDFFEICTPLDNGTLQAINLLGFQRYIEAFVINFGVSSEQAYCIERGLEAIAETAAKRRCGAGRFGVLRA